MKELRKRLLKSFPNIGGFLLPYPGKAVVTKKAFDGQVKGKKKHVIILFFTNVCINRKSFDLKLSIPNNDIFLFDLKH